MSHKLTIDDGRKALADHVAEKAAMIRKKYGPVTAWDTLDLMLKDKDVARFPVSVKFNSEHVPEGNFGMAEAVSENPSDGYLITIHEYFRDKPDSVPAMVLYHLVAVNYGDFATSHEAELFGAIVLGMDQEEYYQMLCRHADSIPQDG